jgi:hypothetical protein
MHITVKHLFVLIVAAMGIVVAVEIINYEYGLEYRKAASAERLALKNIISGNEAKITILARAVLQVLQENNFRGEQIAIQLSQQSIHTDEELGDLNGNLTILLKEALNKTK